jgi:rRNA maturation endonuclease Nob1
MGEPEKFKVETEVPDTTPTPYKEEGNLKSGNEKGVGTDFTERYNQTLEGVIKEKFPNYIDPATMNINFNDIKSLENFNKMNQMKEEILKLVDEKLNGTNTEEAKGTPVFEPLSKEELKTASTEQLLKRGYSLFSPEYRKALDRGVAATEASLKSKEGEVLENSKKEKLEKLEKIFNHLPEYNSNPSLKIFIDKIKNGKEAFTENKKVIGLIKNDPRFKTRTEKDGKLIVVSFDHTKEAPNKNLNKSKNIKRRNETKPINIKENKIDILFEMGGPQAGEILNVSENGKVFQYHILENDGKNMEFKIGEDGPPEIIGLRQAKEFLSKTGIDFTYAENSEENTEKSAETLPAPEQEDAETKLEKEIDELEREISELENLRVAKLEELLEEKKVEEESPSDEESIPGSKETVTENLTKEQYKNALDSIIINKYAKIFEKNNNLQYENTFVTNIKDGVVQKGTIYTEIKFSKGRDSKKFMFLKFELKSQNRVAHLMNERWEVGVFDKLSGFNKENAKKISGAIIQDFIANQKKGNEFKINIEDGDLIMTHQI